MVMDTTDIEKKSLEAHVELCANRYKFLETKLDSVEEKVTALEILIVQVRDMMQEMAEKRNSQLISWGIGIIASLAGTVAFLLSNYVFK
jgi:hypothetical protein